MSTQSSLDAGSVPPSPAAAATKPRSIPALRAQKGQTPLVVLTAYTARYAQLLAPHCDILLVGDSLGQVIYGLPSTVPVTLDMMCAHGAAVVRGAGAVPVVIDMPFGSYEASPAAAFASASRVLKETQAAAVKLEGGAAMAETIAFLVARGIPVMAHIGLTPQAINVLGGYGARGHSAAEAAKIRDDALAVDAAGAFACVIEGVVEPVAAEISRAMSCPTIGIGASAACDGQVLVTEDMLGLFKRTPRFVKRYGALAEMIDAAAADYAAEVRSRSFPTPAQTYAAK